MHSTLLDRHEAEAIRALLAAQDGASVSHCSGLRDRLPTAATPYVQQAAQRTADNVGSGVGSTTATVLAQALIDEGLKHLAVGVDACSLRLGIDRATERVLDALAQMSTPCTDPVMLRRVATPASGGDEVIGQLVADALYRVGADGAIQIEAGRTLTSTLHLVEGVQWDAGFASPHFANDTDRQRVQLDHPRILIAVGTLGTVTELIAFLERVAEAGHSLVIVAEDFSVDVMALLVVNACIHSIRLCALKAPGVGDRRRAGLDDLALAVGCAPFDPAAGHRLGELQISQLGAVDRFECDAQKTVFVVGRRDVQAMETRLNQLRRAAIGATDEREREALNERVALLTHAVAVIRVGAATTLEQQEGMQRADHAIRAARAALREGLVPGGGVAYLRACATMFDQESRSPETQPDVAAGLATVAQALQQPFLQLLGNAGIEALPVLDRVQSAPHWEGFDVATRTYGNLQDMDIVDATIVVRSALRHAAAMAGLFLTTECAGLK